MGPKRRNSGSHSKQSNSTSSNQNKGASKEPKEDMSVQTERPNEMKTLNEIVAMVFLLVGIPMSSHERIRSYWKTLSIDLRKEFLKIRVEDLIHQFGTPATGLDGHIKTVVSCLKAGMPWKAWICFPCSEWYSDPESYLLHIREEHLGSLLYQFLPQTVDNEWIEQFNDCSWEPLDASAAVKLLENRAKSEEASIPKAFSWPSSNDSERAKLLQNIQKELDLLIRHKYLAASHHSRIIKFAKHEISRLVDGSQILNNALDQSPYCICFLRVPELKKIYRYLLELINVCGLVISADKGTNRLDDLRKSNQIPEIKEEILLNEDASCLLLDESLLLAPCTTESAAVDDVINKKDPFLSWILSDSSMAQWNVLLTNKMNWKKKKK